MSINFTFELRMDENISGRNSLKEHFILFEDRFSQCRPLLHFLACRILNSPENIEEAVHNCRITASRNPPRFEHEGAFRSWLVRVLIDEALAILCRRTTALPVSIE